MDREIRAILASVIHPETEENLVDGGYIESITATEEKITVALRFRKARDPFAVKIKSRVESLLTDLHPECTVTVFIKEVDNSASKRKEQIDDMKSHTTTSTIANVIAVASGRLSFLGPAGSTQCVLIFLERKVKEIPFLKICFMSFLK